MMKQIQKITILLVAFTVFGMSAQEKKIKFSKGTLKICSSKNFQIEGYDGNEVIIKSLHKDNDAKSTVVLGRPTAKAYSFSTISPSSTYSKARGLARVSGFKGDSIKGRVIFYNDNSERKKGLKKLGEKSNNADLGIYFTIEQNGDELLFKDQSQARFIMTANESYSIKIPNSLKLNWSTNNCTKRNRTGEYRFFSGKTPSSLSNFNGEVEISSTVNNMKLVDVTGPVVLNTIGGNVTIEFDKKYPEEIYSVYTNNGFIDVQIPKQSSLMVDVTGKSVYSDVDFKVLEEKEIEDVWQKTTRMKLKYGAGKTKMRLNGGFGEVFLRKK